MEQSSIPVLGFIDNSVEKQGGRIRDYRIYSLESILGKLNKNKILISTENYMPIENDLIAKGLIKDLDFFVIENSIYSNFVQEYINATGSDYIVFGDCYFTESDVDDISSESFLEYLKRKYGSKISVLSIHGMCTPSFYYLMKELIKGGCRAKSVAFIVNVPFCNSIQTKLPQSQHTRLLKMICESLDKPSPDFLEYIMLTEERSRNINSGSFSTNNSRDSVEVEKVLTRTRYMYSLKRDNENIVYAEKLIDLLLENNIKPIPFIPAINYGSGKDMFGNSFIEKYSLICEKIGDIVLEHSIEILDMSFLLDESNYTGKRVTKFPDARGREKEMTVLTETLEAL